jgi:hypothetical protein
MAQKTEKSSLVLIVHNVRSALNVGALFRTADGAGVTRIILSGYTPCPHSPRASIARQAVFLTKAEKFWQNSARAEKYSVAEDDDVGKADSVKEGFRSGRAKQHEKSLITGSMYRSRGLYRRGAA